MKIKDKEENTMIVLEKEEIIKSKWEKDKRIGKRKESMYTQYLQETTKNDFNSFNPTFAQTIFLYAFFY